MLRLSPSASARLAQECRRSWIRTSSSPARARTTSHGSLTLVMRAPGFCPAITHGLSGTRGISASTPATAGVSGTMRAPVLPSRSRSSPAVRSTSSHRSSSTSLRRHPVSTSSRIAAAACLDTFPFASSSSTARPSWQYSSSVRNRSRGCVRYLRTARHGFGPCSRRPHSTASDSTLATIFSTAFAA